jgi:Ca2+-transporting ATPase
MTDGLPGLALTMEPDERDTMRRPPHHSQDNIIGGGMLRHIFWLGLLMGLVSLGVGWWAWSADKSYWQTMVFTTLTLSQMGNALAIRSGRDSIFKIGLFSNKPLLGAVLLTFILQLAVVYLPFMQELFKNRSASPHCPAYMLGIEYSGLLGCGTGEVVLPTKERNVNDAVIIS